MMHSKISLTPSIAPEIKTQGCASTHKGWELFGSGPAPNHRSFSPLAAQDGALSLSFNQPIISKFRNNPVRRAAWGRERNLLCGQSLLSARSFFKQIGAALQRPRWRRRGAPGGYRTCQGLGHSKAFRREKSSQALPPHPRDYPPFLHRHHLALNSSASGQVRAPSAARPLPITRYPCLSFSPVFSPLLPIPLYPLVPFFAPLSRSSAGTGLD